MAQILCALGETDGRLVPSLETFQGRLIMSPRSSLTPAAASPAPAKGGKTICPSPFTFEPTVPATLEEAWTPLVDIDWAKEQTGQIMDGYKQLLSHEMFLKASLAKIQKDKSVIESRMDTMISDVRDDWRRFKSRPSDHGVDTEAVEIWCESVTNKLTIPEPVEIVLLAWDRDSDRVVELDVLTSEDKMVAGTWQKEYLMQEGYTMQDLVECAQVRGNPGKRMMSTRGKSIIYRAQGQDTTSTRSISIENDDRHVLCITKRSYWNKVRASLLAIVDDEKLEIVDKPSLDSLVSEQIGSLLAREWSFAAEFFSPYEKESDCETFVLRPLSDQSADVICCVGVNRLVLHRGDENIIALELLP